MPRPADHCPASTMTLTHVQSSAGFTQLWLTCKYQVGNPEFVNSIRGMFINHLQAAWCLKHRRFSSIGGIFPALIPDGNSLIHCSAVALKQQFVKLERHPSVYVKAFDDVLLERNVL